MDTVEGVGKENQGVAASPPGSQASPGASDESPPSVSIPNAVAQHTPGPWHLCQHLKGMAEDRACSCGYRGVIFGPEHDVAMAICQPGHEPAPEGQEGTEPGRYPREVELANARLIAAAPELLEALQWALAELDGKTRYDNDQQRVNCLAKCDAAIEKAVTL